ncbi:hypothetical protein O6P43_010521 [Quillaja saponaria]|uniref:Uncharacterized protein n=1 Tax=Quillaja saponaria TaxID=32244 RepID=A0AAD7VEB2_QUISA|nr:hypothetical protein O6P43_010521 [Quillaja saponaria]
MNLKESEFVASLENFVNYIGSVSIFSFTEINHWDTYAQRNCELPWSFFWWEYVILRRRCLGAASLVRLLPCKLRLREGRR